MKFTKLLYLFAFIMLICMISNAQTVEKYAQDGKVVFQFKVKNSKEIPMVDNKYIDHRSLNFIDQIADEFKITSVYYLHPDIRDDKLKNTVEIEFEEIFKIDELISYLNQFDFIEYAESKELHYHVFTPNDQYYTPQYQWNLFQISAEAAWDLHTGNPAVVVAVTDDAIFTGHPDLTNKMVAGYDVAENVPDPNPAGQADGFHGSHVSGIVGAETNNSIGIASIGFDISIMPIKIARNSDGALVAGYDGIIWAANNGAHVVNMSWGGGNAGQYGQNVVNYAWNQGTIPVAAAGNSNSSQQFYPAAYNNVIAVASTATGDVRSGFSQYGVWIDISAPGSNIVSCNQSGGYAQASGTSMASPLVAGLLGLMKSANPGMSNSELIDCLYSSADNIDAQNPNFINQLGHGRINAHGALMCVMAVPAQIDAGIAEIIQPSGGTCNVLLEPVVVLKNYGTDNLTSVTINYQVTGENLHTYEWTGNLAEGETEIVDLPSITSPFGELIFSAYTSNPNGEQDQNPFNDEAQKSFGIFLTGIPIPWTEDFETGSFDDNLWTIYNPNNGITWELYEVEGTEPGETAAGINLYQYQTVGERDALITPPMNFAGYQSVSLSFEHAYVQYQQNSTDSLIVYISDDCGQTFHRIFEGGDDGTGNFATAQPSQQAFTPSGNNDWCHSGAYGAPCVNINLDQYAGLDNIVIKFESYNNYGNNLFLDNINIDGILVDYDIGISEIIYPQFATCSEFVEPEVVIFNYGGMTITSANIHYHVDPQEESLFEWTGSLATGESETIILPEIIANFGENTLTVYTSEPNGNEDQNPINDSKESDFNVITSGLALPFTEDFESGSFLTHGWTLESPDISTTWDIYQVQGTTPGNKAAGINFFFYQEVGERDAMISPALDFSGHSEIELHFEHAYRRYDQSASDSLIIYVSTDCGETFQRIFQAGEDGTGIFATDYTSQVNFIPTQASQWCHTGSVGTACFVIDLSPWAGEPLVNIKFESYNSNGNNLFIDNINIISTGASAPNTNFIGIPTIVQVGDTVRFYDTSTGVPNSWEWEFEGGSPATSDEQNPEIEYNNIGIYDVTLTAGNVIGTNSITKQDYILVVDEVIYCESMDNIEEEDEIVLYLAQTGYVTGHNNWGFNQFAEHYANPPSNEITGVRLPIARLNAMSVNPTVTFKIWTVAGGNPGTLIYSEDFSYNSLVPQAWNEIVFSETTQVPNQFFIGYEIYYTNPQDTFAITQVAAREENSPITSTSYVMYQGNWWNTDDLFTGGMNSSFIILPEFCPPVPEADFTASTLETCINVDIQFTDNSAEDIMYWEWDFGDGNISLQQNPVHQYSEPGIYTVSLTVINQTGHDTHTIVNMITINDSPEIDLGPNVQACGIAYIDAGSGFESYIWNGTVGEQVLEVFISGNYIIEAVDEYGCIATDNIYVVIYPEPDVSITAVNESTQNANDGSATATATGGTPPYSYQWCENTGNQTGEEATGLGEGTYSVTVTDFNGCSNTASIVIIVEGVTPIANFVADNTNGCIDFEVQFTDLTENNPETWMWDFGDGNQSEEQHPVHVYTTTGQFTVSLEVTSSGGFANHVKHDYISVGQVPDISVNTTPASGSSNADGEAWVEINSGVPPYTIIWSTGEENTEFISGLLPGWHSIIVVDNYNCMTTKPYFVDWASLTDEIAGSGFTIYPNPSEGIVFVEFDNFDLKYIEISDITGKIIKSINTNSDLIKFDLSSIAKGLYLINIKTEDYFKVKKLIIE